MKQLVSGRDTIDWKTFKDNIAGMVPINLPDKSDLFLEAFTPQNLSQAQKDEYSFTQDEIHKICSSCLAVMFARTDDYFFEEVSISFAKIIYQIVDIKWIEDPEETPNRIRRDKLKETIYSSHGFSDELLKLLYGTIGLVQLQLDPGEGDRSEDEDQSSQERERPPKPTKSYRAYAEEVVDEKNFKV